MPHQLHLLPPLRLSARVRSIEIDDPELGPVVRPQPVPDLRIAVTDTGAV